MNSLSAEEFRARAGCRAARAKASKKNRPLYSGYIPKRVDRNQGQIVSVLRRLGFFVQPVHEQGKGVFDLHISKKGLGVWVEVKDGRKSPSQRELTTMQKKWNFYSQSMRCVVTCTEDCLMLNEQVNAILEAFQACGVTLEVTGSRERQYQPQLY